jgi:hypothetical protein
MPIPEDQAIEGLEHDNIQWFRVVSGSSRGKSKGKGKGKKSYKGKRSYGKSKSSKWGW